MKCRYSLTSENCSIATKSIINRTNTTIVSRLTVTLRKSGMDTVRRPSHNLPNEATTGANWRQLSAQGGNFLLVALSIGPVKFGHLRVGL